MSDNIGVHESHCCSTHGCKYGDDDCPVMSGVVTQLYECEICSENREFYKDCPFCAAKDAEIERLKKIIVEYEIDKNVWESIHQAEKRVLRGEGKMKLPINYDKSHWSIRKKAREEYIRQQEGKCYFCEGPLDGDPPKGFGYLWIDTDLFPKNFFNHPVHLHHSHETGMTIGAVHCLCNAILWQYYGE